VPDTGIEVEAFKKAATLGIHRTVHAGESGSAEMVKRVSGSDLLFSTMIFMHISLIPQVCHSLVHYNIIYH
jgi:hypothetical protein